ncbi:hypothetical protein K461DRAFT_295892 [Myriangium duriaei CBS 260.36]|uniref:RING-type domain-containing protein n=1 Tax=Myriangium duriaei CBS 260.36 TaxID=1168546 RepID=A0A9P4IY66_9PEZI|nr:hypothetical protein K461DRAFT_295892 [Myriangium duriaei CBS 260.36]
MPDGQGDSFTDLERELTCSICTDILYQPLTLLDCLHTFCGSCLREWFTWQATNATTRIPYTCPSCRAPVRGTRPNATVTTLLDVLLKASPDKGKAQDEKDKIALVYKPGDDVTPPIDLESDSDSEDQRVLEQARELSLREVEPERARRSTDRTLRHTRHSTHRGHAVRTNTLHRSEELVHASRRQVEHQSSLRSLLSASDIDNTDMEEEIMRQIIDEGLLDGVDLSSMTPSQEEEITERIAQAFRRRQRERSPRTDTHSRAGRLPQSSTPPRQRHRSRSRDSQIRQDRPPLSRPHLLGVATAPEGQRHSRSSSQSSQVSNRSANHAESTAVRATAIHPASRSATDLSSGSGSESRDHVRHTTRSARTSMDTQTPPSRLRRSRANTEDTPSVTSAPRTNDIPQRTRSPQRVTSESRTSSDGRVATAAAIPQLRHLRHTSTSDPTNAPIPVSSSQYIPASSFSQSSNAPKITCSQCQQPDIQRELHYNCSTCDSGNFNLCLRCYRSGKGCRNWFGFGYAAAHRFQRSELPPGAESPHILSAHRFVDQRGENNTILEQGLFCEGCLSVANSCYWHCEVCNEGAWGFCQACVQTGKHCTHPLEAMAEKSLVSRPISRGNDNPASLSTPNLNKLPRPDTMRVASLLIRRAKSLPHVPSPELYAPLLLPCDCDICHRAIPPTAPRYHCPTCSGGDYDICTTCYTTLSTTGAIAPADGPSGWRRCPAHHRTTLVASQERPSDRALLRVILRALVGGHALKESPTPAPDTGVGRWRWRDPDGSAGSSATHGPGGQVYINAQTGSLAPTAALPPDGGVGLRVRALWSYFPAQEAGDELSFPRGAEITEAEDINGDWYWGVYAGRKGLFPGNYGRVVGR